MTQLCLIPRSFHIAFDSLFFSFVKLNLFLRQGLRPRWLDMALFRTFCCFSSLHAQFREKGSARVKDARYLIIASDKAIIEQSPCLRFGMKDRCSLSFSLRSVDETISLAHPRRAREANLSRHRFVSLKGARSFALERRVGLCLFDHLINVNSDDENSSSLDVILILLYVKDIRPEVLFCVCWSMRRSWMLVQHPRQKLWLFSCFRCNGCVAISLIYWIIWTPMSIPSNVC